MNIIQSKGRYYREEVVEKEMRRILAENPNGISSGEFVEKIGKNVDVSRGMIFARIKKFESSGLMRIERDKQDRRKATYFPYIEKVKTEQRFSEGVEFIRNLGKDVRLAEAEEEKSGLRIRASVFTNQKEESRKYLKKNAEIISSSLLNNLAIFMKKHKLKIKPSFKAAYLITLETKKGVGP